MTTQIIWSKDQPSSTREIVISDANLADAVAKALAWHFWIPKDRIHAEVNNGLLTLTGRVEWLFQKKGAEDAVTKVPGLRGVANNIEIDACEEFIYSPHTPELWKNEHSKTGR